VIEHLFVIFPPGAGGNHLANIISTSPRFVTKNLNSYTDNTVKHVHSKPGNNLFFSDDELRLIAKSSSVQCGHFAEYMWCRSQIEQFLFNRKYLLLEFNQEHRNTFFLQRISSLYPAYNQSYFLEEMSTWYSLEYFSKITNEQDLTKIDADLLFSDRSLKIVDYLNSQLGLELDYLLVDNIHQLWLEKNNYR
jgi:hypothetical protein